MPEALRLALAEKKNKDARENFEAFSNSKKYTTYRWILQAKRDETREARVAKTVTAAKESQVAFPT
jgi:uncharacterized protein YdeI (YjbR/CyaY-like superfamily)